MAHRDRQPAPAEAPSILHLVKQVQYKAYLRLEAVLAPFGVTAVQFRLLTTLSTRPHLSSAELARLYGVKPQTMIKQIALLEAKGLIERQVSDANRRLLEVSLTAAGAEAIATLRHDTQELERALLVPLAPTEQVELRRHLETLLWILGDAPDGEEFAAEYSRAGVQRL